MTMNQHSNASDYSGQDARVRELAHEIRCGNDDAFAGLWDLVRPYAAKVAKVRLAKFGVDPDQLEDILSEATVRILRAVRTTFNPDGPWKPFLATVVRNCVKDHVDKLKARSETSLDEASGSGDGTGTPKEPSSGQTNNKPWRAAPPPCPRETAALRERDTILRQVVASLNDDDARLLWEIGVNRRTIKDVATETHRTPRAVTKSLALAVRRAKVAATRLTGGHPHDLRIG